VLRLENPDGHLWNQDLDEVKTNENRAGKNPPSIFLSREDVSPALVVTVPEKTFARILR